VNIQKYDNKKLDFNEEEHEYSVNGHKLSGATTWIKSHWPEFDARRISKYSAKGLRNEIRGWDGDEETLIDEAFPKSVKLFGEEWKQEVIERHDKKIPVNSRTVRNLWKENGKQAAERGTRIHNRIEKALLEELDFMDYMDESLVLSAVNYANLLHNHYNIDVGWAERQIHSLELGIAGTIDLMLESEQGVILVDFKTNDKVPDWDGYNTGLTQATGDLKDSKMQLYTLQLSLYAYMLEQQGYDIHQLVLLHLSEEGSSDILVDYDKELIEEMLAEEGRL